MFNFYFMQHMIIGVCVILVADYARFFITEMLMKFI